jgi:hypothetical protein
MKRILLQALLCSAALGLCAATPEEERRIVRESVEWMFGDPITPTSTVVTNVWKLYYTEGKRASKTERLLLTIRMDSARQFSADDLLSMKASEREKEQ